MPQPIIPVHKLNNHDALFERDYADENFDHIAGSLSSLQNQLLGGGTPAPNREAARYNDKTVESLEAIAKQEEELITAASTIATTGRGQTYYRVPASVTDAELIGLKTDGLVVGTGRVVAFTDRAKTALRDKWLTSENKLKQERTKDGFEHPMRTALSTRFVRTSERKRKIIKPGE